MEQPEAQPVNIPPKMAFTNWYYTLLIGSVLLTCGFCLYTNDWGAVVMILFCLFLASWLFSLPAVVLLWYFAKKLNARKWSFQRYVLWHHGIHLGIGALSLLAVILLKPAGSALLYFMSKSDLCIMVGSFQLIGMGCWAVSFWKYRKRGTKSDAREETTIIDTSV